MPAFLLSESDKQILQEVINTVRRNRINTPLRGGRVLDEGHQAPETYLINPQPGGGIPVVTRGTPDTPGSALCDVFRIDRATGDLVQVTGLQRLVYNATETAILKTDTSGDKVYTKATKDKFGDWYAEPPGTGQGTQPNWGVAIANWVHGTGTTDNCDYIVVNPCDDCSGANPDTGTEITVLLPTANGQDPNLETGDVVAYEQVAPDNAYVGVSNYADDVIGTVKMRVDASIPKGWAMVNGSDNASPGSGIDHTNRFPKHSVPAGTPGGASTHTHANHTTPETDHTHSIDYGTNGPDSHSITGLDHNHTIDFTQIDDHTSPQTDHTHTLDYTDIPQHSITGLDHNHTIDFTQIDDHTSPQTNHTHSIDYGTDGPDSHSITGLDHSHTIDFTQINNHTSPETNHTHSIDYNTNGPDTHSITGLDHSHSISFQLDDHTSPQTDHTHPIDYSINGPDSHSAISLEHTHSLDFTQINAHSAASFAHSHDVPFNLISDHSALDLDHTHPHNIGVNAHTALQTDHNHIIDYALNGPDDHPSTSFEHTHTANPLDIADHTIGDLNHGHQLHARSVRYVLEVLVTNPDRIDVYDTHNQCTGETSSTWATGYVHPGTGGCSGNWGPLSHAGTVTINSAGPSIILDHTGSGFTDTGGPGELGHVVTGGVLSGGPTAVSHSGTGLTSGTSSTTLSHSGTGTTGSQGPSALTHTGTGNTGTNTSLTLSHSGSGTADTASPTTTAGHTGTGNTGNPTVTLTLTHSGSGSTSTSSPTTNVGHVGTGNTGDPNSLTLPHTGSGTTGTSSPTTTASHTGSGNTGNPSPTLTLPHTGTGTTGTSSPSTSVGHSGTGNTGNPDSLTLTHNFADHEPLSMTMVFIERIDNSSG